MKYLASVICFISVVSFGYSQSESLIDDTKNSLDYLSFYYGYEWNEKDPKSKDGSIYRSRLEKYPELNGNVFINRSFDSTDEYGPLQPFLTGVSGWDPVEKVIRFLDFSNAGMMVEGTITLKDEHTIHYDFYFSYPSNKKKLKGRDILIFNSNKTEFTWTSYLVQKDGELKPINEQRMIRGKRISE